jgi:hypothetical protein
MDGFMAKLRSAIEARTEAEQQIIVFTNAVRGLAKACEDKEIGDSYLVALDELSGKPGFVDAVRSALRWHKEGSTPTGIKTFIVTLKKMDLSVYSNPMASIHTTLRRMKESGEVEEFINGQGEKAYRLIKKGGIEPPPQAPRILRRAL